jgi:hypothetical protein
MKKSIRMVFEFDSERYLSYPPGHQWHIPPHIHSQLHIDFFEEYPQESLLRFSEDILGISTASEEIKEVRELIDCAKDKLTLICEIYGEAK